MIQEVPSRQSAIAPIRSALLRTKSQKGESTILRLLDGAGSPIGTAPERGQEVPEAPPRSLDIGPERALLTIVFTDIVGSTETAERLGDHAWCALLLRHHDVVRAQITRFGGREVDTAGDGFFVVFDRPSRAVRFSTAVKAALEEIGVRIRTGIHAGECEIAGSRVEGVAVHVAARVSRVAGEGEILVSATVKDLLAGSAMRFSSRALHALKGLSEPRLLFALECDPAG